MAKGKKKKHVQMFRQHNFSPKVEMMDDNTPSVLISKEAYDKMWHLVDIASQEVGWLGTCIKQGSDFLINDIILFEQEVSATHCEITEEGLVKVAEDILKRPDGVDVMNSIRFWGHSHVDMGTSPSWQDEKQMQLFRDSGHPFFIRAILNKKRRAEFTIFMFDAGIKITDVEWSIYYPVDDRLREEMKKEYVEKVTEKIQFYRTNIPITVWKNGKPTAYGGRVDCADKRLEGHLNYGSLADGYPGMEGYLVDY